MEDALPKAAYKGTITIGGSEILCAVLDNGKRILSERGISKAILGARSGASTRIKKEMAEAGALLPVFLAPKALKPFIDAASNRGALEPVQYQDGNRTTIGYDASILPYVCDIWLRARESGVLKGNQLLKAQKAEILMRGLAHIGIIALVDEATGYQEIRDKLALQKILDKYISKEVMGWQKRFPDEFYEQIYRLNKWKWRGRSFNPPQIVGSYTNDIIYDRLAPGVLDELKKLNPADERGRRRYKHTQWLTVDVGHPKLNEHIVAVMALMRASSTWKRFMSSLRRAFPKPGEQTEMDIDA